LPKFPIWDDVTTFDGKPWRGKIDVVCGGFPCTEISCANTINQDGLDGEHSGLWKEMARIIGEVRPRFAFVENSSMLVVRGLDRVLADLTVLGYNCKWGIMGADTADGPHKRKRLWILAHSNCDGLLRPFSRGRIEKINKREKTVWGAYWDEVGSGHTDNDTIPVYEEVPQKGNYEPYLYRVAHGVDNGVDRLKAIGNGQVPAVAALAWEILSG